jgi:KUP system potassium uptake protein
MGSRPLPNTSPAASKGTLWTLSLSLAALGVVYGDIGTSPLYAIAVSFDGAHGVGLSPTSILGVLSLVFWSLVIVVTLKYHVFVLHADNKGEGGILALMGLVRKPGKRAWAVMLGLFGAALLYGDGMITPAISVISAFEGLSVATSAFTPYIIPLTILVLVTLFAFQRHGTARIGRVFGPTILVWFVTIGVLGVKGILQAPEVLHALNPWYAVLFFKAYPLGGFLVLGAVFLVVTGGEALYADMGHFSERAIQIAWFCVALPALLLNYFGQGALLMRHPEAVGNPFYNLAPSWFVIPLVVISMAATVIASQAIISGAYSLTMQAIHMGYLPRMRIDHTSAIQKGQIYVPAINSLLLVGTVALVLAFKSSNALAGAYGVAITTTMVITTTLMWFVVRERWQWPLWIALPVVGVFLAVDLTFFAANVTKIPDGGWIPLALGLCVFLLMTTWRHGRTVLRERLRESEKPVKPFIDGLRGSGLVRVKGTGVFLTGNQDAMPPALVRMTRHTKVLHKSVLLLTVVLEDVARVRDAERIELSELGSGVYRAVAHYGFMEEVDVPAVMDMLRKLGFEHDPEETTYFLGRERLVAPPGTKGFHHWRPRLFAWMAQNSQPAPAFFRIPPERVVEVGAQITP